MDFMPGFLCPTCFRRLPEGRKTCHPENQFVLASPFNYSNPVARELIHTLKYGKLMAAAEPLASVLAEYLSASISNFELEISNYIILPIPLHPRRERERGFNQALVLAELLKGKSEILREIPILTGVLVRIKPTLSQTKRKGREGREENVRNCFGVLKPELISGKDIFLVDDVFTSGATMREAVRVLKSAGAGKITALAAARA